MFQVCQAVYMKRDYVYNVLNLFGSHKVPGIVKPSVTKYTQTYLHALLIQLQINSSERDGVCTLSPGCFHTTWKTKIPLIFQGNGRQMIIIRQDKFSKITET